MPGEEGGLQRGQFPHPFLPQEEQALELLRGEGRLFAGALHLDETALARHDDVAIHLGVLVLHVGEIEQLLAAEQADADGGDGVG